MKQEVFPCFRLKQRLLFLLDPLYSFLWNIVLVTMNFKFSFQSLTNSEEKPLPVNEAWDPKTVLTHRVWDYMDYSTDAHSFCQSHCAFSKFTGCLLEDNKAMNVLLMYKATAWIRLYLSVQSLGIMFQNLSWIIKKHKVSVLLFFGKDLFWIPHLDVWNSGWVSSFQLWPCSSPGEHLGNEPEDGSTPILIISNWINCIYLSASQRDND